MITPPKTYEELNALIINKVEENYNFEYKSAEALLHIGNKNNKKDGASELIKDVSAMANAAGGIIIYGIKEFDDAERKHLPEKITPIKRQDFSKERIEQIINGNIMPKIQGLVIHPVELQHADEVAYVIEIPQGKTAHQNTKDQRYYKRQNFEATALLDFEIRDIMHRAIHPEIELEFILEIDQNNFSDDGEYYESSTLIIHARNVGNVLAKYVNYSVTLPVGILPEAHNLEANYYSYSQSNLFNGTTYKPILPSLKGIEMKIRLGEISKQDKECLISWRVYADNAKVKSGQIKISQIKKDIL